ncbi:MAG: hypothetical protein H7Y08_00175 [Rhizobiaceae bacterium]|nr:hypothetical protein [Rhizobiaceae bacterium]
MSTDTSSPYVRSLIAILRDTKVPLHPKTRLCAAEVLEKLLDEQEAWAEGGAAEFLAELRAVGWRASYEDRQD